MSVIVLSERRVLTQRPRDSIEVDPNHPMTPRSGGIWVPNGVNADNLITGRPSTRIEPYYSSTEIEQRVTRAGIGAYAAGKFFRSDLPARPFARFTFVALIIPQNAPSTVSGYSAFIQTGQVTLNWHHNDALYAGSLTLHNAGAYPHCNFGAISPGEPVVLGGTYDGATVRVYKNGLEANSTNTANSLSGVTPAPFEFMGGTGGTATWEGWCGFTLWDDVRAASAAEMREISSNVWQVLRPTRRSIFVDMGAGGSVNHDLAAAGQAQAAAIAAISVTKPLGASGAAQSSATAALLKGVSLSAAGLAVASGGASVSHTVPLQASAAAIAVAGAQMSLAVTLSAAGLAVASATAALTVGSATGLAADGQAQASASAVLSLSVQLSGSAIAQALASASLAVGKTLAASGAAQAAGTAALQVGSGALLTAAGTAQASAGATLQLMVPISAAALAQAQASGSLLLTVPLSAAAFAQTSSSAEFAGSVQMSAQGVSVATATAALLVTAPFARAPAGSRFYQSPPSFRAARTQASGRPSSSSTSRPSR